jgi:hypothetical protein
LNASYSVFSRGLGLLSTLSCLSQLPQQIVCALLYGLAPAMIKQLRQPMLLERHQRCQVFGPLRTTDNVLRVVNKPNFEHPVIRTGDMDQ